MARMWLSTIEQFEEFAGHEITSVQDEWRSQENLTSRDRWLENQTGGGGLWITRWWIRPSRE